nr:hypothetical protein [Rhizobium freirei]
MSPATAFVFLLVEEFSHLAFSCALAPLRIANLVADREFYRWQLSSAGASVRTVHEYEAKTLRDGLEASPGAQPDRPVRPGADRDRGGVRLHLNLAFSKVHRERFGNTPASRRSILN